MLMFFFGICQPRTKKGTWPLVKSAADACILFHNLKIVCFVFCIKKLSLRNQIISDILQRNSAVCQKELHFCFHRHKGLYGRLPE